MGLVSVASDASDDDAPDLVEAPPRTEITDVIWSDDDASSKPSLVKSVCALTGTPLGEVLCGGGGGGGGGGCSGGGGDDEGMELVDIIGGGGNSVRVPDDREDMLDLFVLLTLGSREPPN